MKHITATRSLAARHDFSVLCESKKIALIAVLFGMVMIEITRKNMHTYTPPISRPSAFESFYRLNQPNHHPDNPLLYDTKSLSRAPERKNPFKKQFQFCYLVSVYNI